MTVPEEREQEQAPNHHEVVSAESFTSEDEFYTFVLDAIDTANSYKELVFSDVATPWGEKVVDFLNENIKRRPVRKNYNSSTKVFWVRVMSTFLLDCHQSWYREQEDIWRENGLLTRNEKRYLRSTTGTTIEFVHGPYVDSRKEPDLLVRLRGQRLPTVVIESGWSESWPRLRDDVNLWLEGGNGTVMAVILLKWGESSTSNLVTGSAEVYSLDTNGSPILGQTEQIFPVPQGQGQNIRLTRRTFFGPNVFPGCNPQEPFLLDLDILREHAKEAMGLMNLVPA